MGRNDHLHVVMLPWSAFGHMIPFFQLSIALAKAGVHVSFISTPRNIQRLPKVPSSLAPLITLVEFPFPSLDNGILPVGAEATMDLPADKVEFLKVAYDQLQSPIKQFIAEQSPDWIIVDFCPHWAVEIAQEYGVPLILFTVFSAATNVFFGRPTEPSLVEDGKQLSRSPESMTKPPEWVDFQSEVAFPKFEAGKHGDFYAENASGMSDVARLGKIIHACKALAIRTCKEFEGEYLNSYQKIIGVPVIPVGLLPPEKPAELTKKTDEVWRKNFEWLDKQVPKSVVFVGFGSECKLSKDQVYEIAYGLELSQLPFLWALRKPIWAVDIDGDALPHGFTTRTSGRGMVCLGWAPQMEILAHLSIGGSLFHSGWGSVIEILQFGHCLVVLPLVVDQPLIARFLKEKGLAVEVERGEDGSFSRDNIAKALRLAMVSEEGEKFRVRARDAAKVCGDENLHQGHYIGQFVEYLKHGVTKHNQ